MEQWLEKLTGLVWNYPVIALCLASGIFFTLRMALIQIRCFPHALELCSGKHDEEDAPGQLTHFQALTAALSATVGLGNIAGVAIAIAIGGPGSVFWIWIIGFFSMATKYVECTLGTKYREVDPRTNKVVGGPMYYVKNGLGPKWRPMSIFFCIALAMGGFGAANMFQANQVASVMVKYAHIPEWLTGLILASLVGITIIGGIHRIGQVTSKVVPAMCLLYLGGALLVCLINVDKLPMAFQVIFSDAFSGWAAAGGSIGAVIITGVKRAVFSNEAGMGTAPIAHASVKTNYPVREGMVASLGPFLDTIVVCTATAMVIILAGNYGSEMYEKVASVRLTEPSAAGRLSERSNWALNEQSPEVNSLQTLRTGEPVLVHRPEMGDGHYISPPIPVVSKQRRFPVGGGSKITPVTATDGLRFSSHRTGGNESVEILDANGDMIAHLPLTFAGEDRGEGHGKYASLLSLSTSPDDGEWHSHTILFAPELKAKMIKKHSSLHPMRVKFVSKNAKGPWFIDRLQSIKQLQGIQLTTASFDQFLKGFGSLVVTISVFFFCYSTMLTWSYYGETATQYVFGHHGIRLYRWAFVAAAFFGSVLKLGVVLNFSDLMIGLMVIPNAIAMFALFPKVKEDTDTYFTKLKAKEFEPKRAPIN